MLLLFNPIIIFCLVKIPNAFNGAQLALTNIILQVQYLSLIPKIKIVLN